MEKEICEHCHDEEVYSEQLTPGLCLNCYYRLEEEKRYMVIEGEHDYYQGLL